jgi:hypothetical protein
LRFIRRYIFGQEINPRTWAICKSDLLLLEPTEPDRDHVKLGSTLASDQFGKATFDLQFANPMSPASPCRNRRFSQSCQVSRYCGCRNL